LSPGLPRRLADLVTRLLALNPDDRPQTGQEVATALDDIMRSHRLESSPSNIAARVMKLFPPERNDPGIVEFVRISESDVAIGAVPAPRSSSMPLVDVSVSIAGRTAESVTPTTVDSSLTPGVATIVQPPPPRVIDRTALKALLLVAMLSVIALVIYLATR